MPPFFYILKFKPFNFSSAIINHEVIAMKKLPIGVSEFPDMIKKNYYYVDKSLFIKDIIDLPGKVKLITRPRRFGKTLNLNMLKHFFSLRSRENLFEGLKIWEEKAIIKEYFHQFPVIFLSFKAVKDINWQSALKHLKIELRNLASEYIELDINEDKREVLRGLARREADDEEYMGILKLLTQALYETTGKKAIILIDEYDVPIEAAYTYSKKDPDYYDNMVAFMRNMLTSALKDNEYLEFGVLTGVYRVAKESIFSGLNNLAVFTVFENKMSDKFGFTEEEVVQILRHYGLDTREDIETASEWYGRYKVGDFDNLYNPWSVLNYISERLSGRDPYRASLPFWINTSSNDIIIKQVETNPQVKENLDKLLEGKEVIQQLDPWLSLRKLDRVKSGVWTLFVSSGYLTATMVDRKEYLLKIPNKEIEEFFKEVVSTWLEEIIENYSADDMYMTLKLMLREGSYDKFKENLESFIKNSLSYYDFGFKEPERVYKAFLLGILSIAINGFEVESEMESGYGRLDVVVYPKDERYGKYAAIFEVKRSEDEDKLEKLAKKALEQIRSRNYYEKMLAKGCKVIGFGIAFSGKRVVIRTSSF